MMMTKPAPRGSALPALLVVAGAWLQTGCSIVSPAPGWELFKAASGLVGTAVALGPSHASHTVYHLHPAFNEVCIEYNPEAQLPDVVPTLQAELRSHGVQSRVFERFTAPPQCAVWLRYTADVDWGIPPFGDRYQPYVLAAALTLQKTNGPVLSSSQYQLDTTLGMGKWAPTRDKLSPVVAALITGFQD